MQKCGTCLHFQPCECGKCESGNCIAPLPYPIKRFVDVQSHFNNRSVKTCVNTSDGKECLTYFLKKR